MGDHRNILRPAVAIGGLFAFVYIWLASLGLAVGGAAYGLFGMASGVLCGHFYRPGLTVRLDRFVSALECLALAACIGLTGAIASYAAAACSHGFVDAKLAAADAALGLDWMAYWRWTHAHPLALGVLQTGYDRIVSYPSVLLVALCMAGRERDAYRLLLALAIALAITVGLFVLFPARSAEPYYFGTASSLVRRDLTEVGDLIDALRTGAMPVVQLDRLGGYITFPSFHTACAILFAYGGLGLRFLRLPGLALNTVMLLATPVIGSHYFVDVIGGTFVAIFAIIVANTAPSILARLRRTGRNFVQDDLHGMTPAESYRTIVSR